MVKKGGDGGLIRRSPISSREKKLTEISDIEDHSDRQRHAVVIELKRDAEPEGRPQQALQAHAAADDVRRQHGRAGGQRAADAAAADGDPALRPAPARGHRPPRQARAAHAGARVHRLEGLLIALDHLDEVIALIRARAIATRARAGLMERFELTQIQAQAILDLRLQQLTALEADSISSEHADKIERIRELRELLGDEDMVLEPDQDRAPGVSERYGDERRTMIAPSEDDIDIEDLIADQQMVIAISNSGYIKSLPLATYRAPAPRRGRHHRDGPEGGRLHRAPVRVLDSRLPAVLHQPRQGLPVQGLRPAGGRPHVQGPLPRQHPAAARRRAGAVGARHARLLGGALSGLRDAQGTVKKTEFQAYNTPIKADGIIAINIRDDDELVAVRRVDAGDEILMVSHAGLTVRFREDDARAMGRDTSGVRGMDVSGKDNYVLAMDVARPGQDLLVVTEAGYGKRTRSTSTG